MEGELWRQLCRLVMSGVHRYGPPRVSYSDSAIVLVWFWAVLHDRPVSWACRQEAWPREERDWPKPSAATMSRRLRSVSVAQRLAELEAAANAPLAGSDYGYIDGKPLPVGGCSKDRDARWGRGAGGRAKGYKLHAIWGCAGAVLAWGVLPLNVQEKTAARDLIPRLSGAGFLLADNNYDSNGLYKLAGGRGYQLLASRRKGVKGLGHCRQSPERLRAVRMLQDGLAPLLSARRGVERRFGSLGNAVGGLGPLPNFVRGLARVRRWAGAKLTLNALRLGLAKRRRENKRLAA